MKPRPPRGNLQLKLPMLHLPRCVIPSEQQTELVLALVELLVGAAHPRVRDSNGGDDERETHR